MGVIVLARTWACTWLVRQGVAHGRLHEQIATSITRPRTTAGIVRMRPHSFKVNADRAATRDYKHTA